MILDPEELSSFDRYRFMTSAVAPRPIAWVTTLNQTGSVNAAPFSFFNGISSSPPLVMVCVGNRRDGSPKDTLKNALRTGEMVVNASPHSLREEMVATSRDLPEGVSEVEEVGLALEPSHTVAPPRLRDAGVAFECRVERIIPFGGTSMIVGQVLRFVADDALITDGLVDFKKLRPIGRMGGQEYLDHEDGVFEIGRPG